MIIDYENEYSTAQTVTDTAASTNIIDLGSVNPADGEPLMLEIIVTEAVTASGSATVTFTLESDSTTTITPDKTQVLTGAIGKATLVAGYVVYRGSIPAGCLRYSQIRYTVATGPLTAGKFSARILTAGAGQTNKRGF